ncbi:hypothetical protein ADUPG1_004930, partial [Aduncisulcus paluster]
DNGMFIGDVSVSCDKIEVSESVFDGGILQFVATDELLLSSNLTVPSPTISNTYNSFECNSLSVTHLQQLTGSVVITATTSAAFNDDFISSNGSITMDVDSLGTPTSSLTLSGKKGLYITSSNGLSNSTYLYSFVSPCGQVRVNMSGSMEGVDSIS